MASLRTPWTYWPYRLVVTVATVLLVDQPIYAGQFLSGSFSALHTHRENATAAGIAVLVAAVAAVPIRWPGSGPLWPLLASLGLFVLIGGQIAIGFLRLLAIHIPLGVAIIVLAVLLRVGVAPASAPTEPAVAEAERQEAVR